MLGARQLGTVKGCNKYHEGVVQVSPKGSSHRAESAFFCSACPDKTVEQPTTVTYLKITTNMPCGKKRKRHKIATHKRKKRLRMNRHKKK